MLQSIGRKEFVKVHAPEHKIALQIQKRPPMPHQVRHESIPSSVVVSESAGRKRRLRSTGFGFPTSAPRQNLPKTRVLPLIPTCSRLFEGEGEQNGQICPPPIQPNPTKSDLVQPSQGKSRQANQNLSGDGQKTTASPQFSITPSLQFPSLATNQNKSNHLISRFPAFLMKSSLPFPKSALPNPHFGLARSAFVRFRPVSSGLRARKPFWPAEPPAPKPESL